MQVVNNRKISCFAVCYGIEYHLLYLYFIEAWISCVMMTLAKTININIKDNRLFQISSTIRKPKTKKPEYPRNERGHLAQRWSGGGVQSTNKFTKTIVGIDWLDMYLLLSYSNDGGGVYDLYYGQPPGGNLEVLALLWGTDQLMLRWNQKIFCP